MIIHNDNKTIEFKTLDIFYEKEKSGIKNNTVRKMTKSELEYFLSNIRYLEIIKISRIDLSEYFERHIKDISFFEDLVIFTWYCIKY